MNKDKTNKINNVFISFHLSLLQKQKNSGSSQVKSRMTLVNPDLSRFRDLPTQLEGLTSVKTILVDYINRLSDSQESVTNFCTKYSAFEVLLIVLGRQICHSLQNAFNYNQEMDQRKVIVQLNKFYELNLRQKPLQSQQQKYDNFRSLDLSNNLHNDQRGLGQQKQQFKRDKVNAESQLDTPKRQSASKGYSSSQKKRQRLSSSGRKAKYQYNQPTFQLIYKERYDVKYQI